VSSAHNRFIFAFPRNYEVKLLSSYLPHPAEKLYQYPSQLEERDRTGIYLRVSPPNAPAWTGFFSLGFDSQQVASGIYSCPDPDWLCAVVGGYAYVVDSRNPEDWRRIEQRPAVEVRAVADPRLLLFIGFTSITGMGESGRIWTTPRLSWEGLKITEIEGPVLRGTGWDAIADKEIPFEVDLTTGQSSGGSRPMSS
jgi:hypothetical protein